MAGTYVVIKKFEVPVDLKKPAAIRDFELVEGDTGNEIEVTVSDGGTPVELTGCTVLAVFSHSKGSTVLGAEDGSLTVDGSCVTLKLPADAVSAGPVECELQIYSSTQSSDPEFDENDVLVTTARFNFNCRKAILNQDTLPAAPHFPLLAQTIAAIEAAESARAQAEAARAQAEAARAAAETARSGAEQARAQAEQLRVLSENGRVSDENARAAAEAARAAAEAARAAAEAERAEAEAERAEAEAERELALAEHIAGCGLGVLSGSTAPTSSTEGEAGRLRYDTSEGRLYICRPGGGSYNWEEVSLVNKWNKITEFTLSEDVSVFEIGSPGGRVFSCSELRLTLYGFMRNAQNAAVRLNGSSTAHTFTLLMNTDATNVVNPVCQLLIQKETEDTVSIRRYFGGVSIDSAAAKNVLAAYGVFTGAITRVSLTATGSNGLFKAGMRVVLEGR